MRVLFVSDNTNLREAVESIIEGDFPLLETKWVQSQNLDFDQADWWRGWDVVFSIHCKRIFPSSILGLARFYNLHPGLNPHNRGWFPQVFHILNGLPIGATLHEIDAELDHGRIVGQTPIQTFAWDTSKTIYDRVLEAEIALMRDHLKSILENDYSANFPVAEGNVNWKRDFDSLCELDMTAVGSLSDHIDYLRALSHFPYRNAFFCDEAGKKIYVELKLTLEE